MSWMRLAFGEYGEAEVPGPRHNPRVVEYHQSTSYRATSDEVPWCSSFVCWVLERAGIRSTRSARARSWMTWKGAIKLPSPVSGCVVVLRRGRNPAQGHVGFFLATHHGGKLVVVLGGNQGDTVSVRRFHAVDVLGYYWPPGQVIPFQEVNDYAENQRKDDE